MLHESFISRRPSHFYVNPVVKAFVVAETLLWSSWNLVTPIFAIFAATQIPKGNIEVAASSYSTYLIVRVFSELASARLLLGKAERELFLITMIGVACISCGYLGFSFASSVPSLYYFYAIIGFGLGIASPAKHTLFSSHLDKNKAPLEWGVLDAMTFTGMAITATVGGFIAQRFGFQILFLIAAFVNLTSALPYLPFLKKRKNRVDNS